MSDFFTPVVLCLIVFVGLFTWKASSEKQSIKRFFWGNRELPPKYGIHLLWSSSLSLNGLFYHTYLGYKIGIFSLFVQLIWVGSFIIMLRYLKSGRLKELAQSNTLHGNIGSCYGREAQLIAGFASALSFVGIAAWELSVVSDFISTSTNFDGSSSIHAFALLVLVVAALYTIRGGMYVNARVNNALGIVTFIALIFILFGVYWDLPSGYLFNASVWKLDIHGAILFLGVFGLISNALFSLFWQVGEMSTWQTLTSVSMAPDGMQKSLIGGIVAILFAPGLVGTLLGMSVAGQELTDSTVLSAVLNQLSGLGPYVSVILLGVALFIFLGAALTAFDGQLLALGKVFVFDIFKKETAHHYLVNDYDDGSDGEEAKTRSILRLSFGVILLSVVIIYFVSFLTKIEAIPLFDLVYIAVVGQVSIVPATLYMLNKKSRGFNGLASIVAGILFGTLCIWGDLAKWSFGEEIGGWLTVAPVATFFAALIFGNLMRSKRR